MQRLDALEKGGENEAAEFMLRHRTGVEALMLKVYIVCHFADRQAVTCIGKLFCPLSNHKAKVHI